MTDTGDKAVVEATNLWKQSMDEADKAFDAVEGLFSTKGQADDVIGELMEENVRKAQAVKRSPDAARAKALANKYETEGGLSMSEINEAKRIHARQHTYTYEQRASDEALRSKYLQDDLRNWQFKTAEENGLANIAEINKTTK